LYQKSKGRLIRLQGHQALIRLALIVSFQPHPAS
jgi:hypothetical protein